MLFARSSGYLRLALATLALLGQLTPVVALPIAAITVSPQHSTIGGCAASASCACSPLERANSCCCCSKHESTAPTAAAKPETQKVSCCEEIAKRKRKSCCETTKPEKPEPPTACKFTLTHPPEPTAKITPGGKCRCDKLKSSATSEPAMPPFKALAIILDSASQPNLCCWAVLVAVCPVPPPFPPPRA